MTYHLHKDEVKTILIPLKEFGQVEVILEEEGAQVHVLAFFVGLKKDKVETRLSIVHRAPCTYADVKVKRVLSGKSYCSFKGLIQINKNAQLSNSYLADDTLLLTEGAQAESIPSLEIKTDDVEASHGATLGKIDDNQLFYLRSRGISEVEAKRLIVEGFFQPILQKMENQKQRQELSRRIRLL